MPPRLGRPTLHPTLLLMRLRLLILPAALAWLTTSARLDAQEGTAPRVLQLSSSSRAMALGDAYMMDSGHADALFYHPALVSGAAGFGLDVQSWSGEATAAAVSAAMDWFGGTVAVGLQTLQYGAPSEAVRTYPTGQDLLFALGPSPTSERVASVAFAREVFGVRLGVGGKLVEERISGERDATFAVDVGLASEVGPLTVGLSARNLGPEMGFPAGEVPLPRRYTLGVGGYGEPVGPFDLGVAGHLTYDETEWTAGAGLEIGYWPIQGRTFVGRIGVQRVPEGDASPLTAGFAYWGDDLVLEWAWQAFGGALDQATHRFGVRWR